MMKICRLLYICCLWGVFSLSYGQHKTDWSRERLQKAIKTLRIKGYHVIENGSMAQKGALIAEMNLEKTFDSQGNIILEIYFDDKNAETLRYELVQCRLYLRCERFIIDSRGMLRTPPQKKC